MSEDRLEPYRKHEVSPNDFKATKTDHEAALMTLSEAVSEWAERGVEDDDSPMARRVEAEVPP